MQDLFRVQINFMFRISPMQNAAVEEDDKVSETKIKTLRKMSVVSLAKFITFWCSIISLLVNFLRKSQNKRQVKKN